MKGLPLKQPSSSEKMIQQLGGGPLGLAAGVGVDIQGSLDVRMPQQLLHLLGSGSGGQQVGGEGMPLRYNKDKRKNPVFSRVSAFVVAYSIPFPTLLVNEKSVE